MAGFDSIRIPWPDWVITDELGEGGYGKVYKIRRIQSGVTEYAALKVISIPKSKSEYDSVRFSLDTEADVNAFFEERKDSVLEEIVTMQRMKGCANIVTIDDWTVTEKEDLPGWDIFIRMELLTPFKEWFGSKKVTEAEVIKLGTDICTALARCEKEDFIHRDIKPENILVSRHGDYKLADFGIARTLDHTTYVTRAGTPPYMSPEIYAGDAADRTVDLYSLGLVMYELLNDRRLPFVPKGRYSNIDVQAAIRKRMDGEAIPEPENGSAGLKKIVLKACAYDPHDRYRSAAQMKTDLERLHIHIQRNGDTETDRLYTQYRRNEEFQKQLDEEYSRLKAGHKEHIRADGSGTAGAAGYAGKENAGWADDSGTVGAAPSKKAKKTASTMATQADGTTGGGRKAPAKTDASSKTKSYIIAAAAVIIGIILFIAAAFGQNAVDVTYTETTEGSSSDGKGSTSADNTSDTEEAYLSYLSQQSWDGEQVIYAVGDFLKELSGEEMLVYTHRPSGKDENGAQPITHLIAVPIASATLPSTSFVPSEACFRARPKITAQTSTPMKLALTIAPRGLLTAFTIRFFNTSQMPSGGAAAASAASGRIRVQGKM